MFGSTCCAVAVARRSCPGLSRPGDQLHRAKLAWQLGNTTLASQLVGTFADTVKAASGTAIPNVWRSSGDLVNVGGDLRAAAGTLRFSLNLAG